VGGILSGIGARLGIEFQTECEIPDQYIGPGYGVESDAGREAFQLLARTEGILLDPVYTAKAMAGMLDWIRTGRLADARRVLFWHTGGQMALFHA
jgi:1-aminocyclopropane-1-carboxylate deaminase/D-cysteine desulfhydrase-like pyridoxal-dependent ACC family enzyme